MVAAKRPWWPSAFAVVGSATASYFGAAYYSGTISYAPLRSSEWVREHMNKTERVKNLFNDTNYTQVEGLQLAVPLARPERDGSISQTMLSFRDRRDPLHTVTFVHCGPFTCGFPFLVHGGVLGTLLYQSVHLARQVPEDQHMGGNLSIKYRKPTLIDQILCIETQPEGSALKTFISSTRSGHKLVEGLYVDP